MRRRKQALFYCLMALLTLLSIELMAQAAYYIAYREFNGAGPTFPPTGVGADPEATPAGRSHWMSHPYYGYVRTWDLAQLNQPVPPRREPGVALIALLGGSVAWQVVPDFRSALETWFRDNDIPLRPVVLAMANGGWKQPQQVIAIANTLALGGEYDLIVNLDGFNELVITELSYFSEINQYPFFPYEWRKRTVTTSTEKLLVSRIYALRQRQQRLDARAAAAPWRWSALYGIVNRYLRERAAAQILALNHDLTQAPTKYSLESHGPVWPAEPDDGMLPDPYDLSRIALRVWYRSSILLDGLARDAGAEYYHFLQPNQYVPNSKPLSDRELTDFYDHNGPARRAYREAHPHLLRFGAELRRQGVNYHDLTQIFADNTETLYRDRCCHLNPRGNQLLAASMVQELAPALRSLARGTPGGTALDAAQRERSPVHSVNKMYFDVRLSDRRTLLYSRDQCRPADTAAPFFVQIAPPDADNAANLPPAGPDGSDAGPDAGPDSYDVSFSFDRDGGRIDPAGRCVIAYQLPAPAAIPVIPAVLTGQYHPDTGQQLWSARLALNLDLGFTVTRTAAGRLRYFRADCLPVHLVPAFFLHITPAAAADLHPHTAARGFNNLDFSGITPAAAMPDAAGRCAFEQPLPDYPIASIVTGQYLPQIGRRLWQTRLDLDPDPP